MPQPSTWAQKNSVMGHYENRSSHMVSSHMPSVQPTEMNIPFTSKEVEKAVKFLKNNTSAGWDDLKAELIRHSPEEILNCMAKSGEHPMEMKKGILIPLPKPGKKQGPAKNLRPIILPYYGKS